MTVVCQEHFPDKPLHILTLTGMTPGRDIPVEPSGETEMSEQNKKLIIVHQIVRGPSGELIYRRLSDDGMPVTAG